MSNIEAKKAHSRGINELVFYTIIKSQPPAVLFHFYQFKTNAMNGNLKKRASFFLKSVSQIKKRCLLEKVNYYNWLTTFAEG